MARLFSVLAILLLAGSAVLSSALWVPALAEEGGKDKDGPNGPPFVDPLILDMPEMLVDLRTTSRRTYILKLTMSLVLTRPEDHTPVLARQTLLLDMMKGFLRDLTPEDLHGSAGLARVRAELLLRANAGAEPMKIADVLFKEILVAPAG